MRLGASPSVIVVEDLTQGRVIAGNIRLASDSAMRRRGLLDVRNLDSDSGLWIEPCEAVHTFGMHIDLDVIFLDAQLRVRKITQHLKPNRISFCVTARSVLEVRAGSAESLGVKCGDQLAMRPSGSTVTEGSIR